MEDNISKKVLKDKHLSVFLQGIIKLTLICAAKHMSISDEQLKSMQANEIYFSKGMWSYENIQKGIMNTGRVKLITSESINCKLRENR